MGILSFIGELIKPVTDLIDNLSTSDEEKLTLTNELVKIQNEFSGKALDYESQLMQAQAKVITTEATGHSWIQRNWRPITMLTFLILVVCDSFGLLVFRLAPEAWTLLQVGLGGYVVGRSAEKIVPKVVEALKNKK